MLYSNMIIDGTYQVIEEIGSGGMGIVYLAYHLRLQKYIVLKKIKNPYADISMLRNEVDILKGLHHPYLPQVYDFIEFEGDLYTVIDYIDGYDLNYYIDNGIVFSESQLIKWLRQLCEVLHYLHSHTPQILHTDIKPGNIIVTTNGDICLIDFGISLYNTDVIKGLSENYSSPEQYGNFQYLQYGTGEYCQLDERTDIYSLGASFYHIMTGVRPDVTNFEQPDISQYALEYTDAFVNIISKSMKSDLDRRYRNASEMLKAIDDIKKHDLRYKKYIAVQVISSLLAAMFIVSGVLMCVDGYNQEVVSDFQILYNQFISMADIGNASEAVSVGQNILNNSEYSRLIEDDVKAKILHKIGDVYYESEDFFNASYYYKLAIDYDAIDLFYRDYALALISDNQIDEAKNVVDKIKDMYPDSSAITLAEALLCYKNEEFIDAINTVNSKMSLLSGDSENLYTANIIKGDSYNSLKEYNEAVKSYEAALASKETVTVLRKTGNAYLKYAEKTSNTVCYKNALNYFKRIYENYYANLDDIVNLAQSVMLSGETSDYEECKSILLETAEKYEDCRLYIMLTTISDATDDPKTEEYCRKAHQLYKDLSDNDKVLISSDSIGEIKRLYKKYCGQDW